MSVFKPIKCTSSQLSNIAVIDGQLIFTTDTNEIYLDDNGFRSNYNNSNNNDNMIFTLESNSNASIIKNKGQEILNAHNIGKNCIIILQDLGEENRPVLFLFGKSTILETFNDGSKGYKITSITDFKVANNDVLEKTSSRIGMFENYLTIYIFGDDSTKCQTMSLSVLTSPHDYISILETNKNYSTPYIPIYAGSPATKKYVDDSIKTAIGDALGGSY